MEGEVHVERNEIEDMLANKSTPQARKTKRGRGPSGEAEYRIMMSLKEGIDERNRLQRVKQGEVEKDPVDWFCQRLALDLKSMPRYQRCVSQQEVRDVIFKHQVQHLRPNTVNFQSLLQEQRLDIATGTHGLGNAASERKQNNESNNFSFFRLS